MSTLHSLLRYARRQGWIVSDPVAKLERGERPRPRPRRQRVLGREEVSRLLACTADAYGALVATALVTGMRISELLGLVWSEVDFESEVIRVSAQLSRPHRGEPARRVAPKTSAAVREIPLVPQLALVLRAHRDTMRQAARTGGCSRRGPARRLAIATFSAERWPPPRSAPGLRTAIGRRFASTTSDTRSPAI